MDQKWTIVREQTDDRYRKPQRNVVLLNGQAIGYVQSYKVGRDIEDSYETLELSILCPDLSIVEVSPKEYDKIVGIQSKYTDGNRKLSVDDLEFASDIAETVSGEKSDEGS